MIMETIRNKNGFALIEVLIAMVVFAIGVLGIAAMQCRSVTQNRVAYDRTKANAVAVTVLEELKRLPFDDPGLAAGGGDLDAGKAPAGKDPTPGDADQVFDPALFPALAESYQIDGNNNIVDGDGRRFQLFWNVLRATFTVGADTYTPYCTIRLFVYWDTPLGKNHIETTTVKYNNVEI